MRNNSAMSPSHVPEPAGREKRILPGEMLRRGAERLRAVSDTPGLDCELLLAHALGVGRASLYARASEALDAVCCNRMRDLLEERAAGRPIAQITGRKEFFSLDFEITEEVLVPRPETELLVELVAGHPGAAVRDADCMDLGTGCGAVGIALARLLPESRMIATEVSEAALHVARRNAARLAPGRIRFVRGSWYEAVGRNIRFDAIAANPPYVESQLCRLRPLCFEPGQALDGGADGLRHLRAVIYGAPPHLKPGGMLAVEHGANQGEAVRAMMAEAGLAGPRSHCDLAGRERVSVARLSPEQGVARICR